MDITGIPRSGILGKVEHTTYLITFEINAKLQILEGADTELADKLQINLKRIVW